MSRWWMVFELPGAPGVLSECGEEVGARVERGGDAGGHFRSPCRRVLGNCNLQRGIFRATKLVDVGDGSANRSFATTGCGFGGRLGWVWWSDGRNCVWAVGRL